MRFQRVRTSFVDALFFVAGGKSEASQRLESLGLGNSGSGPGFFSPSELRRRWDGGVGLSRCWASFSREVQQHLHGSGIGMVGFGKKLDCSS